MGEGAVGIFDYDGSYTWGGLRHGGAHSEVVYLSFGFEAIATRAERLALMRQVFDWLTDAELGDILLEDVK